MMLEHLGHPDAALCITDAIETALADPSLLTGDLGGDATTKSCGAAITDLFAAKPWRLCLISD